MQQVTYVLRSDRTQNRDSKRGHDSTLAHLRKAVGTRAPCLNRCPQFPCSTVGPTCLTAIRKPNVATAQSAASLTKELTTAPIARSTRKVAAATSVPHRTPGHSAQSHSSQVKARTI